MRGISLSLITATELRARGGYTSSPHRLAAVRPRTPMPSCWRSRDTLNKQQGAPYGCVFVVDQIKKADEAYKDFNALMPGKVAVWTTEHDPSCKKRTKVPHPAAEFIKDELRHYPIIVVTHVFYNGLNGNKAHVLVRDKRVYSGRALTVVDERPEEVAIYEITLKEAQDIREKLEAKRPELKEVLDRLLLLMMPYT